MKSVFVITAGDIIGMGLAALIFVAWGVYFAWGRISARFRKRESHAP